MEAASQRARAQYVSVQSHAKMKPLKPHKSLSDQASMARPVVWLPSAMMVHKK
jgi:hypothetical protein